MWHLTTKSNINLATSRVAEGNASVWTLWSGSGGRMWTDRDQDVRFDQGEDGVLGGPRQAVGLIHSQAPGAQRLQGLKTRVPCAQPGDQAGGQRAVHQPEPLPHPAYQSTELPERLLGERERERRRATITAVCLLR